MFFQAPPPSAPPPAPLPQFVDVATDVGMGGRSESRLALVDLNHDGRPDLVLARRLVFLNTPDAAAPRGFRFVAAPTTLPDLGAAAVAVFADFDNDGSADAFVVRDADKEAEAAASDKPAGPAAVFCRGKGDGTFDAPVSIAALGPAHTAALAVGDVDGDGRLDVYRGNWYRNYGSGALDAPSGDLLLQRTAERVPASFVRQAWPEDERTFDEDHDAAGRPTYGAMIARLSGPKSAAAPVQIAQLNYGRRWNRLYAHVGEAWTDVAPAVGFDGDDNRTGVYPAWLAERAKTDKRFDRENEKPFRSNGNNFDISVGDVNGDGLFDCFIADIAHAWAGPSSDRSRFLIAEAADTPIGVRFTTPAWACVDRIPAGDGPESRSWNQGDLFCEIADVDNDGRLDLILASGDYPDPPPFDERLRIFRQRAAPGNDGRQFEDVTLASGVNLPGAAQLAVGDLDLDGDVDIVCAQSFTRFTKEMIASAGGTPQVRVYLNQASDRGQRGTTLLLTGDPAQHVPRDAIGAVVTAVTPASVASAERRSVAQLVGPGGHSGKQRAFQVHFGNTTPDTKFVLPPGVTSEALPSKTP